MFDIDVAWPFSLGLVAAFNPCGFAMLPIYVSYFMGTDSEEDSNLGRNVLRAVKVAAVLTAGFVAVFGAFGIVTSGIFSQGVILERTPWITFLLGFPMVALGIAMLFGYELKFNAPRIEKGGNSRELSSMFLFGVSYAVVSLGCTVGLFLTAVSSTFGEDFVGGVAKFVAYGLGMGSIIAVLTIAMAFARSSIARNLRRVLPWVNRISGVLLILSGIYLSIYGWYEIQVLRGNLDSGNPLISLFEQMQNSINMWIQQSGSGRIGVALLLIVAAALIAAMWQQLDRLSRVVGGVALAIAWLFFEFVWQQANLFIRPVVGFLIGFPARIGNWFTDPFLQTGIGFHWDWVLDARWGVLLEALLLAGALLVGVVVVRRFRGRPAGADGLEDQVAPVTS